MQRKIDTLIAEFNALEEEAKTIQKLVDTTRDAGFIDQADVNKIMNDFGGRASKLMQRFYDTEGALQRLSPEQMGFFGWMVGNSDTGHLIDCAKQLSDSRIFDSAGPITVTINFHPQQ